MEPIRHGTAVGQPQGARRRISRPHVDPMGADLLALFVPEPLQALQRRRRVLATLHRQDLRPSRVAQIGHQRHVEPVPLLQRLLTDLHQIITRLDVVFVWLGVAPCRV